MRFLDEFVPYLLYLQLIILNVTNKQTLPLPNILYFFYFVERKFC